jgi:hypothetical protein
MEQATCGGRRKSRRSTLKKRSRRGSKVQKTRKVIADRNWVKKTYA